MDQGLLIHLLYGKMKLMLYVPTGMGEKPGSVLINAMRKRDCENTVKAEFWT